MPYSLFATETAGVVGVVTDSAACIPKPVLGELSIAVAPLSLVIDGEAFEDGALPASEFYSRLRSAPDSPKTAGASPAAFLAAFRATGRQRIVCVTVSSRFSATYANALLAARDAGRQGLDVRVVDAEYAAMAQGFVALAAARAAASGATLEEAEAAAQSTVDGVGLVMMLESLEHLARGGRVPKVAAWATSLLQVRPLVEFREREIKLAGRARTRHRALESLVELLRRRVEGRGRVHLAVHHADALDDAEWLATAAERQLGPASIHLTEFTQVMAAHVGPGLVGYAYSVEQR
jgi:DegV family protein with EDD domain